MSMKSSCVQSVAAAFFLLACGAASGQTHQHGSSGDGSVGGRTGGVRAPMAPRISLGGVKAQVPPPSGISRKGSLLTRTGTLLPPAPTVTRRPIRPWSRPRHLIPTGRPDLDGRPIVIGPGYVAHPENVSSSTGVFIKGRAGGDHWNLKFHLGSGYTYSPWWKPWHYPTFRCADWSSGGSYGRWWYPSYSYTNYNTPLVYGQVDPYVLTGMNPAAVYSAAYNAQAAQQAPGAREPTPLERADTLLMYGEAKLAAEAYRKYLEDAPDDASAMRSLALALLNLRRFDESVAVMAMAYEKQPRLARTPIDPAFFGGAPELRKLVNSSVTYANRVNSGSAWLLVATLIQAEERDDVAAKMVERAKSAGLSETVATELADVLRRN